MLGADYSPIGVEPPLDIIRRRELKCKPLRMAVNPKNGELALGDAVAGKLLVRDPITCS